MILHPLNNFLHEWRNYENLIHFVMKIVYWHYLTKVQYPRDIIIHSWLVWKSSWLWLLLSFVYSRILVSRIAGIYSSSTNFHRFMLGNLLLLWEQWQIIQFKTYLPLIGTALAYGKRAYVLLVGKIRISMNGFMFNVLFPNCILITVFLKWMIIPMCLLVLK